MTWPLVSIVSLLLGGIGVLVQELRLRSERTARKEAEALAHNHATAFLNERTARADERARLEGIVADKEARLAEAWREIDACPVNYPGTVRDRLRVLFGAPAPAPAAVALPADAPAPAP